MATNTFTGKARRISQVTTVTVSDTTNTRTSIIQAEHPSGAVGVKVTIASFTNGGSESVTTIATGLAASFALCQHEFALALSCTSGAGTVTFTANKSGDPFILTVTSGTASPAPTQSTSVANSGPNDLSVASNFEEGAVIGASADVRLVGPVPILYGLALSGTSITSLSVYDRTGPIGGPGVYLQVTTAAFTFNSWGTSYIDLKASAIGPLIEKTAMGEFPGLYLKGTAISNNTSTTPLTVNGGYVAVDYDSLDASTCQYILVQGARFCMGPSVVYNTYRQIGGSGIIRSTDAAVLVEVSDGGKLLLEGESGTITTLATYSEGTRVTSNHKGTITNNNNSAGGITDFTKSRVTRSVGTITNSGGGTALLDPSIVAVTTYTRSPVYGGGTGTGVGGGGDGYDNG